MNSRLRAAGAAGPPSAAFGFRPDHEIRRRGPTCLFAGGPAMRALTASIGGSPGRPLLVVSGWGIHAPPDSLTKHGRGAGTGRVPRPPAGGGIRLGNPPMPRLFPRPVGGSPGRWAGFGPDHEIRQTGQSFFPGRTRLRGRRAGGFFGRTLFANHGFPSRESGRDFPPAFSGRQTVAGRGSTRPQPRRKTTLYAARTHGRN